MREIHVRGKLVGVVNDKNEYVTKRYTYKHFFKKGQGYPISVEALKEAKRCGALSVVIIEVGKETRKFSAPISSYLNGTVIKYSGYDEQKYIKLKDMKLIEEEEK